jgi:hypothetical protein
MRARAGTVLVVAIFSVLAFARTGCGSESSESAASRECRSLANFAKSARQFARFVSARSFDNENFEGDWVGFQALDAFNPPNEIRNDVHVLAEASAKFVDALVGVDVASPDPLESLQKLWTRNDQKKVRQASQNISAWVKEKCP